MIPFEFATAQQIAFGPGKLKAIHLATDFLGTKTLIVCGASQRFVAELATLLPLNVAFERLVVENEPTISDIADGVLKWNQAQCQSVISLGGGSVIDAGKAIAALATNPGDPMDYLEVVGRGKPLQNDPAPFVAIPTTAGTGAEVTRNTVLAAPEHRVKVSLRSLKMLPRLAIVDPDLTQTLDRETTANGGLDALTQLVEPFLSSRANPLTDALCQTAIPLAARALKTLADDLNDVSARENLAYAALCGGLALANAGLGAVHGFAGPIGGMYPAPHGAVCARLLPFVLQANLAALERQSPESIARQRFDTLAPLLTGSPNAKAADGIRHVEALVNAFAISPLSQFEVTASEIPQIVAKAQLASSMKGNPIRLSEQELTAILHAAL